MKEFKLTLGNLGEVFNQLTKIAQSKNVPFKITVKEWREKRSISANGQYHVWLPTIAKHYGEDEEFIRQWMKHTIAWPILERGGCDYSKNMRWIIEGKDYSRRPIAQQIKIINMFKVTSVMDSAQHTTLRDELQIYWAKQGLQLNYLNGN